MVVEVMTSLEPSLFVLVTTSTFVDVTRLAVVCSSLLSELDLSLLSDLLSLLVVSAAPALVVASPEVAESDGALSRDDVEVVAASAGFEELVVD